MRLESQLTLTVAVGRIASSSHRHYHQFLALPPCRVCILIVTVSWILRCRLLYVNMRIFRNMRTSLVIKLLSPIVVALVIIGFLMSETIHNNAQGFSGTLTPVLRNKTVTSLEAEDEGGLTLQEPPQTPPDSIFLLIFGEYTGRHGLGSVTMAIFRLALFYQETRNATLVVDQRGFAQYRRNHTHGLYKGFLETNFPVLDRGDNVARFMEEQRRDIRQQQQQHHVGDTSSTLKPSAVIKISTSTNKEWMVFFKSIKSTVNYMNEKYGSDVAVYGKYKHMACGIRFTKQTMEQITAMLQNNSIPLWHDTTAKTVAFHIRRGDKIVNGESRAFQAAEYVQKLVQVTSPQERAVLERCYVATDDFEVIGQVQVALQNASIACQVYTTAQPQYNEARNTDATVFILADMYVLIHATYFVGTFNSNVGTLAALWRSCVHAHETANESN